MKRLLLSLLLFPQMLFAATRSPTFASRADIDAAINGGTEPESGGQVFSGAAPDGTLIQIPSGVNVGGAWATPITVTKNLQIIGAGPGATTISGGQMWKLTCNGSPNLMRLSGLSITQTAPSGSTGGTITIGGFAPFNDSDIQHSGFRLDHIVITGTATNRAGDTLIFSGWIEGVVDHYIMDDPLGVHLGETIIINHTSSPTGTGKFGDYSFSNPYTPGTIHQLIFENCIFHRSPGTFDTQQFADAGGARYTSRHNSGWGQIGSTHDGARSGNNQNGPRSTESYKNLCVRDGNAVPAGDQASNFNTIRSGEGIVWGNRYNRIGGNAGIAASPLALYAYNATMTTNNTPWEPADGTGRWDENQRDDTFSFNGNSHNVDSGYTNATNGVTSGHAPNAQSYVYAHGTCDSTCGPTTNTKAILTVTPGPDYNSHSYSADYWAGFVIRNLSFPSTNYPTTSFAYIAHSSSTTLSVALNNSYTPGGTQFILRNGDKWEMRKVKEYFEVPGRGEINDTFGEVLDSTKTGTVASGAGRRLTGAQTPNPRWTNQTAPGVWQWDNRYRTSLSAGWTFVNSWGTTADVYHLIYPSVHNDNSFPPSSSNIPSGYSYDGTITGNSSHPDTLVGADAEAWSIAPSDIDATNAQSVYQDGAGGYPIYPHPLVGTNPVITPATATFSTGTTAVCSGTLANCVKITTLNFSSTAALTIGSWSPSVSNITFRSHATDGTYPDDGTATISGTATGTSVGVHTATITGNPGSITQVFALTVTTNSAPSANISSPSDGATISGAPATVNITVAGSDSDGTVDHIDIFKSATVFDSTTRIGTVTGSSGSVAWTSVAVGTYSLTAKATDNASLTGPASSTVHITVSAGGVPTPATIQVRP